MIYLDNASTTQVSQELKSIIDEYLYDQYGNAGSKHKLGDRAKIAIAESKRILSFVFQTHEDNIIFTSSGSEANTLAIIGLANYLEKNNTKHIITSAYEHHSVLNAMKEMELRGFKVTYLHPNSDGVISVDDFKNAIKEDTGFASIMFVNNELGTKNNIEEMYTLCKENNIIFHSDCVQAISTECLGMEKLADMISVSGHKIHAPKGVGCLCTKVKEHLSNIIFGGEQEFGLRPGTENVAFIKAFSYAANYTYITHKLTVEKLYQLTSLFGYTLLKYCERENIKVHFNASSPYKTPKICSVRFDGVDAETLTLMLSNSDICVSSGAACSSRSSEPSHVLKAIGLSDEEARSTIRVSVSALNTDEEMESAAKIIVDCVKTLQQIGKNINE